MGALNRLLPPYATTECVHGRHLVCDGEALARPCVCPCHVNVPLEPGQA